jgi:phosphosulfolactate phosphohydrolase-like enzyme
LFVAGPPDLLDEQQALNRIDDPTVRRNLEDQSASFKGEKGAILMAVSAADGKTLAQYDLDNPPVFDGLIAAGSRLYMTTTNGEVLCMTGK